MAEALASTPGRSSPIAARARARRCCGRWPKRRRGRAPDEIAADAARAGYDVTPIRPLLEMLAART